MVSAGWTKCGNTADTTYYQISGGVLTLINDGVNVSSMCWRNIPRSVSNWLISTSTAYAGGGEPSVQLEVTAGGHDYRVLDLGGGYGVLMLLIDGNEVAEITSYIPEDGVFHLLSMQMRSDFVTVYSEGLAAFTYPVSYTNTSLSLIYLTGAWEAHDRYDYLTARQVDPNAADFSIGVNPSRSTVNSGQTATLAVSVASINNFSRPVSLNAYQYQGQYKPTVNISPTTVTPTPGRPANSTLTITTDQVLATSSIYVIVNATSGSLSYPVQVILDVYVPPPDFSLDPAYGTITLVQHGDGSWPTQNLTVTIHSISRFAGNIGLSTGGGNLPGLSGQFFPSNVSLTPNGSATSVLQVSFSGQGANGFYVFFGYATSGLIQHPIDLSVYIAPSYFSIAGSANPVFVSPGSPAAFSLTLTSHNNFSSTVNLASQLSPAVQNGPVLTVTPSQVALLPNQTTHVTVTITVQSYTPVQAYQATVNANGAWWSASINLTIYPAAHSFSPGVSKGTWATYNIDLSNFPQNTLSARLTVLQVGATNVTYTIDLYLNQVFQNSTTALLNVYFGTFSNPTLPLFLVPSNLGIGDLIYPGQPASIPIQTQHRQYLDAASRTVNIASSLLSYTGLQVTAAWDMETGMLASLNATVPLSGTIITAQYRLTGTNAWAHQPPLTLSISSLDHTALFAPVKFTSTVSGGTPPYSYSWNFGDGATSTEANPLHSYLRSGNYTVTLQIMDSDGNVESSSTRIAVSGGLSPQTVFSIPSIIIASWPTIALAAYVAYACILAILIIRQEMRRRPRNVAPEQHPY